MVVVVVVVAVAYVKPHVRRFFVGLSSLSTSTLLHRWSRSSYSCYCHIYSSFFW
jgi:hypothetical protein